ncbi:uncharacterized protein LOC141906146 [Tubulanus polymorphus]|uniref:uncharacterized protein LOC141906146 n=1 Tax=Tubulanus polymorphus TaxID=672921 RepID=UPI003DA58703
MLRKPKDTKQKTSDARRRFRRERKGGKKMSKETPKSRSIKDMEHEESSVYYDGYAPMSVMVPTADTMIGYGINENQANVQTVKGPRVTELRSVSTTSRLPENVESTQNVRGHVRDSHTRYKQRAVHTSNVYSSEDESFPSSGSMASSMVISEPVSLATTSGNASSYAVSEPASIDLNIYLTNPTEARHIKRVVRRGSVSKTKEKFENPKHFYAAQTSSPDSVRVLTKGKTEELLNKFGDGTDVDRRLRRLESLEKRYKSNADLDQRKLDYVTTDMGNEHGKVDKDTANVRVDYDESGNKIVVIEGKRIKVGDLDTGHGGVQKVVVVEDSNNIPQRYRIESRSSSTSDDNSIPAKIVTEDNGQKRYKNVVIKKEGGGKADKIPNLNNAVIRVERSEPARVDNVRFLESRAVKAENHAENPTLNNGDQYVRVVKRENGKPNILRAISPKMIRKQHHIKHEKYAPNNHSAKTQVAKTEYVTNGYEKPQPVGVKVQKSPHNSRKEIQDNIETTKRIVRVHRDSDPSENEKSSKKHKKGKKGNNSDNIFKPNYHVRRQNPLYQSKPAEAKSSKASPKPEHHKVEIVPEINVEEYREVEEEPLQQTFADKKTNLDDLPKIRGIVKRMSYEPPLVEEKPVTTDREINVYVEQEIEQPVNEVEIRPISKSITSVSTTHTTSEQVEAEKQKGMKSAYNSIYITIPEKTVNNRQMNHVLSPQSDNIRIYRDTPAYNQTNTETTKTYVHSAPYSLSGDNDRVRHTSGQSVFVNLNKETLMDVNLEHSDTMFEFGDGGIYVEDAYPSVDVNDDHAFLESGRRYMSGVNIEKPMKLDVSSSSGSDGEDTTKNIAQIIISEQRPDMQVERGRILISNQLEGVAGAPQFMNVVEDDDGKLSEYGDDGNVFQTSFYVNRANPMYDSNPDLSRREETFTTRTRTNYHRPPPPPEKVGIDESDFIYSLPKAVFQSHLDQQRRNPATRVTRTTTERESVLLDDVKLPDRYFYKYDGSARRKSKQRPSIPDFQPSTYVNETRTDHSKTTTGTHIYNNEIETEDLDYTDHRSYMDKLRSEYVYKPRRYDYYTQAENYLEQNSVVKSKSKLVNPTVTSVNQNVHVDREEEEIIGEPHLVHADGTIPSLDSIETFDSVSENVELGVKNGRAQVEVKVRCERTIPIWGTMDMWRKTAVIITRIIEIDLESNEESREWYKNMMSRPRGQAMIADGSSTGSFDADDRLLSRRETFNVYSELMGLASKHEHAGPAGRSALLRRPSEILSIEEPSLNSGQDSIPKTLDDLLY